MTPPSMPDSGEVAVVQVAGGPITLQSIDWLGTRRQQLLQEAAALTQRARQLTQDAAAKATEAGAALSAQRSSWKPAGLAPLLGEIDSLTDRLAQLEQQLGHPSLRPAHGLIGAFEGLADRIRRWWLTWRRGRLAAQLTARFQTLGEKAPVPTIPPVDALLVVARRELQEAASARERAAASAARAETLIREIRRRRRMMRKVGFDALWMAAWLQDHEPPEVDSPLTLRHGEVAWVSVEASLSRLSTRTRWVGGSSGFSFPIGRTGIRYRVGSYRAHQIKTTTMGTVDRGWLVLTNQRLVFMGQLTSIAIGLSHIVGVRLHRDGLAVFHDRKEVPEFFKMRGPRQVLFYIHYAVSRHR